MNLIICYIAYISFEIKNRPIYIRLTALRKNAPGHDPMTLLRIGQSDTTQKNTGRRTCVFFRFSAKRDCQIYD